MWGAQEPELVRWLDVPDRKLRQASPMTPEIEAVVSTHFFNLYTSHFSQPSLSEALACIPQASPLTRAQHSFVSSSAKHSALQGACSSLRRLV